MTCKDIKEGDIYHCEECGMELKVIKGCGEDCSCEEGDFSLKCCGKELDKKE